MSIQFDAAQKRFTLNAGKSTYIMEVAPCGALEHVYFGATLTGYGDSYRAPYDRPVLQRDRPGWIDRESPAGLCLEFTSNGIGDQGITSGVIRTVNGFTSAVPLYKEHRIFKGKGKLKGMPCSYGNEENCDTLEVTLRDDLTQLEYILSYTVFAQHSVIARSVRVVNCSKDTAVIEKLYSATMHLPATIDGYEMISFSGTWARERHVDRYALTPGVKMIGSTRGTTTHTMNPSFVLVEPETTETNGMAVGQLLIYTGSWQAEVEVGDMDTVRSVIGLNPANFHWQLAPGAEFQTPEMLLMWSNTGLEGLTHTSHDFFRQHILRGPWRDLERPVLINNWEATYFDFNEEKLLALAKTAKSLGIEMLVLDDGWFGHRDTDNSSLGDWFVDKKKLPGGIDGLSKKIHELGLKFGLWFEPEMISEDSELYKAHPDYCLHIDGRIRSTARQQMVLDMSRKEVVDCIFAQLCKMFDSAQIDYMKWDCNRIISEAGSAALPPKQQGEVLHRYTLGLYDLLDRLTTRYPNLLIEGCAGGGGRFDAGLLCYAPQIWCSDNSDASARLFLQYGTSIFYPCSTMGAHVSDCPNHQVRRTTPFATRGLVALAGTFGYELDPNRISEEDRQQIPAQIKRFHEVHHLVTNGDYYRNITPNNNNFCAWSFVSKDRSECIATAVAIRSVAACPQAYLKFRGLDADAIYTDQDGHQYSGSMLMNVGLRVYNDNGDNVATFWHLKK